MNQHLSGMTVLGRSLLARLKTATTLREMNALRLDLFAAVTADRNGSPVLSPADRYALDVALASALSAHREACAFILQGEAETLTEK